MTLREVLDLVLKHDVGQIIEIILQWLSVQEPIHSYIWLANFKYRWFLGLYDLEFYCKNLPMLFSTNFTKLFCNTESIEHVKITQIKYNCSYITFTALYGKKAYR